VLNAEINKVLNHKNHRWFLGKLDKKEAAKRKKAAEDFKKRYK